VLDRYRIEGLLGSGAFGAVYRGRSLRSGAPVAIKVEHSEDAARRSRFEREATLLSRINHPNVVSVLDFGHLPDGAAVIVMEFIAGKPLDKVLLERGGSFAWKEAVTIGLGLLDGLEAVHEAGVLHRDVKPANILIVPGELPVVKLVDFGVAKATEQDALQRITKTGEMLGSLGYMAPEQLTNDPVDARTDLYAAGGVLYQMLSGALPYTGEGMRLATTKVSSKRPPPMRKPEAHERWPESLETLVSQMLDRHPDQRPANAFECATSLRAVLRRRFSRPSRY
jgi:serine/threonine-protein kinase